MNFRRIFLVKCLLLLFSGINCSNTNTIYRAVNESALLSVAAAGSVYDAVWWRDGKKWLQIKDNNVKYYVSKTHCRCKLFVNGTLKIDSVVKEDSGKYTVFVYNRDGTLQAENYTVVIVEEPVPQPILSAECLNKTVSVKCEVKQKPKDEIYIIELTHGKTKKIQKNATKLELHTRYSGMFKCVVQNQVSKKATEKTIKCSGQLDLYLILSIAGGAIFFVIFVILLIYCIRKKKAERLQNDGNYKMGVKAPLYTTKVFVKIKRTMPEGNLSWYLKGVTGQADNKGEHNQSLGQGLLLGMRLTVGSFCRAQQQPRQQQQQQQPLPPRPRPRTQPRTPTHPRERP
ncbi:PREDICTED: T-cell surface antigen CD2-like [Chaetura pelagica]|uniref:T-cell surface antigen CD2-like n=1 Tax=Chaetura pelagica TaxID=8897 RepID=UPI0005238B15|nr:PREDICTED: T-cell surface antigen CD2-like [Chaetura pelagica]